MKTIQVTIDEPLLARLDVEVGRARVPRALFIRSVIEQELERLETIEKVRIHQEAYTRMPQTDDEFLPTDPTLWEAM